MSRYNLISCPLKRFEDLLKVHNVVGFASQKLDAQAPVQDSDDETAAGGKLAWVEEE